MAEKSNSQGTVTTGQTGEVTTYYYTMGESETPEQAQAGQVAALGGGSQAEAVVKQSAGQGEEPRRGWDASQYQNAPRQTVQGIDTKSPSFTRQAIGQTVEQGFRVAAPIALGFANPAGAVSTLLNPSLRKQQSDAVNIAAPFVGGAANVAALPFTYLGESGSISSKNADRFSGRINLIKEGKLTPGSDIKIQPEVVEAGVLLTSGAIMSKIMSKIIKIPVETIKPGQSFAIDSYIQPSAIYESSQGSVGNVVKGKNGIPVFQKVSQRSETVTDTMFGKRIMVLSETRDSSFTTGYIPKTGGATGLNVQTKYKFSPITGESSRSTMSSVYSSPSTPPTGKAVPTGGSAMGKDLFPSATATRTPATTITITRPGVNFVSVIEPKLNAKFPSGSVYENPKGIIVSDFPLSGLPVVKNPGTALSVLRNTGSGLSVQPEYYTMKNVYPIGIESSKTGLSTGGTAPFSPRRLPSPITPLRLESTTSSPILPTPKASTPKASTPTVRMNYDYTRYDKPISIQEQIQVKTPKIKDTGGLPTTDLFNKLSDDFKINYVDLKQGGRFSGYNPSSGDIGAVGKIGELPPSFKFKYSPADVGYVPPVVLPPSTKIYTPSQSSVGTLGGIGTKPKQYTPSVPSTASDSRYIVGNPTGQFTVPKQLPKVIDSQPAIVTPKPNIAFPTGGDPFRDIPRLPPERPSGYYRSPPQLPLIIPPLGGGGGGGLSGFGGKSRGVKNRLIDIGTLSLRRRRK